MCGQTGTGADAGHSVRADGGASRMTHTVSDATLRQIRIALAAMLCADEEHCPTLREARLLCVEAMRLINTELNTKNADAFKPTE